MVLCVACSHMGYENKKSRTATTEWLPNNSDMAIIFTLLKEHKVPCSLVPNKACFELLYAVWFCILFHTLVILYFVCYSILCFVIWLYSGLCSVILWCCPRVVQSRLLNWPSAVNRHISRGLFLPRWVCLSSDSHQFGCQLLVRCWFVPSSPCGSVEQQRESAR